MILFERHLSRCQALIFPGEEDFGITPVEAQASGRPVIAYHGGGALETVVNHTGMFFHEKTPEAIVETVQQFNVNQFDPMAIQKHARQFDISVFRQQIQEIIGTSFLQPDIFTAENAEGRREGQS